MYMFRHWVLVAYMSWVLVACMFWYAGLIAVVYGMQAVLRFVLRDVRINGLVF